MVRALTFVYGDAAWVGVPEELSKGVGPAGDGFGTVGLVPVIAAIRTNHTDSNSLALLESILNRELTAVSSYVKEENIFKILSNFITEHRSA